MKPGSKEINPINPDASYEGAVPGQVLLFEEAMRGRGAFLHIVEGKSQAAKIHNNAHRELIHAREGIDALKRALERAAREVDSAEKWIKKSDSYLPKEDQGHQED